jgi:myo-inositol-1(or 4)-monophosphatase
LIKEAFSAKKEIKTKDCFADLVTETDENVEKIVISTLKSSFPTHE